MIVTIRRTFTSSRMTFGQMSMGSMQCSTLEPPMPMFQTKGEAAIPEGQYPMAMSGDDIVVEGIPHRHGVVLGRDIVYGMSVRDTMVVKREEAHAIFHKPIAEAISRGDDVLLDVVNTR
jgi:hypothetical protein